ncbi:hypothetical protein ABFS82_14G082200 [Erythranthe guttata]
MDTSSSILFLFLLSILVFCSSSSGSKFLHPTKDLLQQQLKTSQDHQTLTSYRRELVQLETTIKDDFLNPPITTYPTNPAVTNPVTTPAITNPVTTPATTITAPPETPNPTFPVTGTPTPTTIFPPTIPVTDPVLNPPITNPVTTIPGQAQPGITNPVTTTPVVGPPATTTSAPAVPGQSWCVAKGGLPDNALQAALDYACGLGGADCSGIQEGASCYNPNSMQNHASYAFNSYYQRNPVQTSCDFGGTAMVTNVNPGSGSCIFTTSSSASPTMPSPFNTIPTPTPSTESSSGASPIGFGTPPAAFNGGSPALGGGITGFGESPLGGNSTISTSSRLKPFIGCIIVVTSFITRRIVSDI